MAAQYSKMTTLIALAALALSGCLGGLQQAAPPPTDVAYTEAAKTIVAELTANAPTLAPSPTEAAGAQIPLPTQELLPPTSTPLPTNPPPPTEPPPPTLTPVPTNTPLPTSTPTETVPPEPVFREVFSDNFTGNTGWYSLDGPTIKYSFPLGGYSIENLSSNAINYSVRERSDLQFVDVRVEVTGSRFSGPLSGFYGVVCRFGNGSNYYFLAVGSDGWFGIGKFYFNVLTILVEGKNTTAVRTGNTPNLIRGDCIGNKLSLTVNGMPVAEVEDTDFSAGGVGVMVGTNATGGYRALFDDFKVSVPE